MNTTPYPPAPSPEILAPAGDSDSFLAALAAGADAVYCGLKHFSARMEADNFSTNELASLTALAHDHGRRVYVAMNTLIKPTELAPVGRMLERMTRMVMPDAIIFQDLAMVALARQTGFPGELHLSTLAAASPGRGVALAAELSIHRVVLPRELSIDEIKAVARMLPPGLALEVFVHGALCYAVSGRCSWSSLLGGKSGLRGRCVQPCRRRYRRKNEALPLFSCDDLGLGVLVRLLNDVPAVRSWKIEGRKKGPHYVFHTVRAYQLLRDHGRDPKARREAEDLLAMALGRTTTRYFFLGHKPRSPLSLRSQTGSGLVIGSVSGGQQSRVQVRESLLCGDLVRVGLEDAGGSFTVPVRRPIPKGGRLDLPRPAQGQPVFLVDRRPPELQGVLRTWRAKLPAAPPSLASDFAPKLPQPKPQPRTRQASPIHIHAWRRLPDRLPRGNEHGIWFLPGVERSISRHIFRRLWWWLPPIIWPEEEPVFAEHLADVERLGGRRFVLGAPWQRALLSSRAEPWAGPFCHAANALCLATLADLGLAGAFASFELDRESLLALPGSSPLPMGVVVGGMLPACVARVRADILRDGEPLTSPKGEVFWTQRHGSLFWTFPNWEMDLSAHQEALTRAGYQVLATLHEWVPKTVPRKQRPGLWNWELGLI